MKNIKLLWWGLIFLGIVGGILFFPVPIECEFTCLFHRMVMPTQAVPCGHHDSQMVDYYVNRFGYFWWGSLFLAAAAIYQLTKMKKVIK